MTSNLKQVLNYSQLDQKIWDHELEGFVPKRIFDVHTHLWDDRFATPLTPQIYDWREHNTSMEDLRRISEILFPKRDVHFLTFPIPNRPVDYDGLTEWIAMEVESDQYSYAAMLVTPDLSGAYVENAVHRYSNIVALKPYYTLVSNSLPVITDYFTEEQMEVADSNDLAVILHLPDGPERSLPDLEQFVFKYPGIRWILAHCAASGNPYQLERTIHRLRDLPNLWYDTSGNNELYTLALLLKYENRERLLFGTDNTLLIGGCRRSKSVPYAYTTHYLHLNPERATFRCYEQLRIMRHACKLFELSSKEVECLFFDNAQILFHQLKK